MSLFISFVLISSVLVSKSTESLQGLVDRSLIAESLSYVSTIINNIEDKILQEKEILSQIIYDLNHEQVPGFNGTVPFSRITDKDTPFIQDLKKTMSNGRHGYYTAFLTKFMELLYKKDPPQSYQVVKQLNVEAKRYLDAGQFNSLGETLKNALRSILSEQLPKMTPAAISQQAGYLHFLLKDKELGIPKKTNDVLDFYDKMFTKTEGETLFATLEHVNDFPHGNITALQLSEEIFEAAIKPYAKNEGKRVQKEFIQLIYTATENVIPHYRVEPESPIEKKKVDIIKEHNQSAGTVRRSINNHREVIFRSKYPKLLKVTPRYPRHFSHEMMHHHKHDNSRGRRRLYESEHARESSVSSSELDERIEGNSRQTSANHYEENLKAHRHKHINTRQSTKTNEKRSDELTQQMQIKSKQIQQTLDNISTENRPDYFIRRNPKVLLMKMASSSKELSSRYFQESIENDHVNDEEYYIKKSLYDAFKDGNKSHASFKKAGGKINNTQLILRALSSETDEEWLLKNNIYKVFEQAKKQLF